MCIEFVREDNNLVINLDSGLLSGGLNILRWGCGSSQYAELLKRHFIKIFNEQYIKKGNCDALIGAIRMQAYEKGYKDCQNHSKKKKYFNDILKDLPVKDIAV